MTFRTDAFIFVSLVQKLIVTFLAVFWARILRHLAVEEARFRMTIILGVVLIRSLACSQCVPGGLQSGAGVVL